MSYHALRSMRSRWQSSHSPDSWFAQSGHPDGSIASRTRSRRAMPVSHFRTHSG